MGASAGPVNTTGRETELKLRVRDLADLMRVAAAAAGAIDATAVQTNAFLDTPDRAIDAARFALRVRTEVTPNSKLYVLTAKGPRVRSADGAMTSSAEEELVLTEAQAASLLSGATGADDVFALLAGDDDARQQLLTAFRAVVGKRLLAVVGSFTNERTRIVCRLGEPAFEATLELDRTLFPGNQIHHEVEMEVPAGVDDDHAHKALLALFARAGVTGVAAPGKARRFFAALRGEKLEP